MKVYLFIFLVFVNPSLGDLLPSDGPVKDLQTERPLLQPKGHHVLVSPLKTLLDNFKNKVFIDPSNASGTPGVQAGVFHARLHIRPEG